MPFGATVPDGIGFLLGNSNVDPVSESSSQASTIQAAFDKRPFYQFVWNNTSDRNNQTGMRPGDQGYQRDISVTFTYAGSAIGWQAHTFGPGRVDFGTAYITTAAGSPSIANSNITFRQGFFPAPPKVLVQAETSRPDVCFAGVFNISAGGATLSCVTTNGAYGVNVHWLAVY